MRALLAKFWVDERGNAVLTYLVFTGCWAALVACGVSYGTPKMTVKLQTVSQALGAHR